MDNKVYVVIDALWDDIEDLYEIFTTWEAAAEYIENVNDAFHQNDKHNFKILQRTVHDKAI